MRPRKVHPDSQKYQCALSDKRIDEMAAKRGRDPYEVARNFGAPTPRVVKAYGLKDLVTVWTEGLRYTMMHPDLITWSNNRCAAFFEVFGVDPHKAPRTLKALLDAHNTYVPFPVWLCGQPEGVEGVVVNVHRDLLEEALQKYRERLFRAILHYIDLEYQIGDKTIDSDQLLAAGYDDDIQPPDPDDYW